MLRKVMWIGAAMCAAWGGTLHAQPARRPAPDLSSIVATPSSTLLSRIASWKVPSPAYVRERKAMLAELRRARALWTRRRPAAYAFRVDLTCPRPAFCPNAGLKITVPGDPRVAASYGVPASMEEVFAQLEQAVRSDHLRVSRLRFHPRLGYPLRWTQDPAVAIAPWRRFRWVRDFHPLPPPPPARRMKQTAVAIR